MKGRAAEAKYTFTDTQILDTEIGWEVMSEWEDPIMVKHGEIVTKNGGDILEFGFGMGISATHIQSHDINSHTIIEINDDVYERLLIWTEDKPNVIPIKGDWADSIPDKQYDAIFYDPYGDMKNKPNFPWLIAPYCKEGTILSWYNNVLRTGSVYSEKYEHHHHYWNNDRITYHEVELEIPDEARIKWYLEGEGNIYYAPELIIGENDNRNEFKRIWMGKRGPV
jgi:hypothetical protein